MAFYVLKGLTRAIRKKVVSDDGNGRISMRHETVGIETADIQIEVDMEALAKTLGEKAMRSKRRVSKALHGRVTVRAINIRKDK